MSRKRRINFLYICIIVLLLFSGQAVLAANGYAITWWSVDGGGGMSTGGSYTVNGTIGQTDTALLTGSGFSLQGGFWSYPGIDLSSGTMLYLPSVVR